MKRILVCVILTAIFVVGFGAVASYAAAIQLNLDADDPLEELPPELLYEDYLPNADLAASSKDTLAYLRNRLYANHGYVFKTKKWRDVFTYFYWYKPNPNFSDKLFNKFERENLRRILAAEKGK